MIINLKNLSKLKVLTYLYSSEKDLSVDSLERELRIKKSYIERILREYILKGYIIETPLRRFRVTEKVENLTLYDFLDVSHYFSDLEYLFGDKNINEIVIEETLNNLLENLKSEASKITFPEIKFAYNKLNSEMFYL